MTVTISGGNKLQAFLTTVSKQKADLKVGYFPDDKYPDGTPIAQVAVWNEYGNPGIAVTPKMKGWFFYTHGMGKTDKPIVIPPRPFMSDTVKFNKSKWFETFTKIINSQGKNIDVRQAFNNIGSMIQGNIQERIANANSYYKANADFTKMVKGKDSVLRHTNKMLNNVRIEVK